MTAQFLVTVCDYKSVHWVGQVRMVSVDPGHEYTVALTILATANPLTTQGQPTSEQLLGLDARRK